MAVSALPRVSAVCATGSGDVKIVVGALAKTSLAPLTRGRRLVSAASLPLSDLEQPASAARQIIANAKPRARPSRAVPNFVSPMEKVPPSPWFIAEKPNNAAAGPERAGATQRLSRCGGDLGSTEVLACERRLKIAP